MTFIEKNEHFNMLNEKFINTSKSSISLSVYIEGLLGASEEILFRGGCSNSIKIKSSLEVYKFQRYIN